MYQILNWNTALTEKRNTALTKTEKENNLSKILQFIKKFLDGKNTIAVLQQIPFKMKNEDGSWIRNLKLNFQVMNIKSLVIMTLMTVL